MKFTPYLLLIFVLQSQTLLDAVAGLQENLPLGALGENPHKYPREVDASEKHGIGHQLQTNKSRHAKQSCTPVHVSSCMQSAVLSRTIYKWVESLQHRRPTDLQMKGRSNVLLSVFSSDQIRLERLNKYSNSKQIKGSCRCIFINLNITEKLI